MTDLWVWVQAVWRRAVLFTEPRRGRREGRKDLCLVGMLKNRPSRHLQVWGVSGLEIESRAGAWAGVVLRQAGRSGVE